MAQFKQFLKQLEIKEGKAITVLGGAKTKTIASSAIKPPRPIRTHKGSTLENPRGTPRNKTHNKSAGGTGRAKTTKRIGSTSSTSKALTVTGTKVSPTSSGPKPIRLKRIDNTSISPSHPSSGSHSSGGSKALVVKGNNSVTTAKNHKKSNPNVTSDAIFTGIGNRPSKLSKVKKKKNGIVSKALNVLIKKGHGTAQAKGFIHPPLSKVSSKK